MINAVRRRDAFNLSRSGSQKDLWDQKSSSEISSVQVIRCALYVYANSVLNTEPRSIRYEPRSIRNQVLTGAPSQYPS